VRAVIRYGRWMTSPVGRATRRETWLGLLVILVIGVLIMWSLASVIGLGGVDVVLWAMTWPTFTLFFKRFHDRGRSGWIVLMLCAPICGLFVLMELLFMPTRPNQRIMAR